MAVHPNTAILLFVDTQAPPSETLKSCVTAAGMPTGGGLYFAFCRPHTAMHIASTV